MKDLRIGIVGMGNAGRMHAQSIQQGKVPGAVLSAVACRGAHAASIRSLLGAGVAQFEDAAGLCASGVCDAVFVATPHALHAEQSIAAFGAGLHVLCEKPAGIRVAEARAMSAAADRAGRVYALNFNRRTVPLYTTLRELVRGGSLGALRRFSWTSTAWLRVQSYYDSSPWRGTWAGEGGGLLLNQLPHVLDLWQWIFGSPARLWASAGFGRYHDIEVEDEVHVVAEYPDGAKAVLVANSGEAPGIERLEIVGERATVVAESNRLTVTRLTTPVNAFIRSTPAGFEMPESQVQTIDPPGDGDLVTGILRNFVACIREGVPLCAPGSEGSASLELANAILLSAWQQRPVELPLDEVEFESLLRQRQRDSRGPRELTGTTWMPLERSFTSAPRQG